MKKFLSYALVILLTIGLIGYGFLSYTTEKNRAIPGPSAEAALASTDAVNVEYDDWLVMSPKTSSPSTGVIIYPGANCDIRGYAEIMRAVAAQGYLVVGTPMPFNFAFLNPYEANDVMEAYPEITNWVIVGHSLGGAMAGTYAHGNQDKLGGIIFWDAYPPEGNSLADSKLPVMHIHRATLQGEPPQMFQDMQHVYPPGTMDVPVKGGIHMYFGSFIGGPYEETWEPKISNAEQIEIIIKGTLDGLAAMQ